MPATQKTLRKRDSKEAEIDNLYGQEVTAKNLLVRVDLEIKESIEKYQIWKKMNGVPGIKY